MREEVTLQFTQEDRDMLRDTSSDVKRILLALGDRAVEHDRLESRVSKLEDWRIAVMAICTAAGFVGGLLAKLLWR